MCIKVIGNYIKYSNEYLHACNMYRDARESEEFKF